MINLETQREETDRVIKERDDVQAESVSLKVNVEARCLTAEARASDTHLCVALSNASFYHRAQ